MVFCVRRDFAVKIDGKSLALGIVAGIVIGSIASVVLTKSLPFGFTANKQYTATMKMSSYSKTAYGIIWCNCTGNTYSYKQIGNAAYGDHPKYPNSVIAVFIHNNITAGQYEIWYNPVTNITLQENDYTVEIYDGKTGLYIETLEIFVAKDIEIEI